MEGVRAVVIGGTGACGSHLVATLLKSKESVNKVTLLSRKRIEELPGVDVSGEEREGRLTQHVEDLDTVSDETVQQLCTGAHVFCNTLGTTRARAGSAEAFRHIDMEIPLRMMKLAREAGVKHCSLLTSAGSKAKSWFLYLRTKGELEEAVRELGFPYLSIFRPGVLDRGAAQRRFGERLVMLVSGGLPVETVGRAMALDAITYHQSGDEGAAAAAAGDVMVADNNAIRRLAQTQEPSGSSVPSAGSEATSSP